MADWVIAHFPPHNLYVEPFGGAASVLLRKPRVHAEIYNDLDGEIVNLFRVLRTPADGRELVRLITLTPFSRHEYEAAFLVGGDPIEQARRTLVKAGMGFGSNSIMKRTGFRPGFQRNGPIPARDWTRIPDNLEQIVERLRGVVIEERPAADVIRRYDTAKTLHYIDPPYPLSTRGEDSRYRHEMTDQEHRELSRLLHELKGMVVISGYQCGLYEDLYEGWHRVERSTHADGGRDRVEILWISPNAVNQPTLYG